MTAHLFPYLGERPIADIQAPEWTKCPVHGFRAMATTVLDEVLNVRVDYIEHQLAHAVQAPNGRAYNRTSHLRERRKMMQLEADYLDDLREGRQPASAE